MRALFGFLALSLVAVGCGDKDGSSDTGKAKDTSVTGDDTNQPSDSGVVEPTDDGRLRPGAWLFTVTAVIEHTCGGFANVGDVQRVTIAADEDDNHKMDDVLAINYNEDGSFGVNGVLFRQRSDGDCATETTVASSGQYSDWQTVTRYGRDEIYSHTGAECVGWAINDGEPCSIEVVYSAEWVGENFPDEE